MAPFPSLRPPERESDQSAIKNPQFPVGTVDGLFLPPWYGVNVATRGYLSSFLRTRETWGITSYVVGMLLP